MSTEKNLNDVEKWSVLGDGLGFNVKNCNEYNEDGVQLSGNLVVFDFSELVDYENHIDLIKARIKAEELLAWQYGEYERLLCHPKLVIRIKDNLGEDYLKPDP
ncbi:hypothetical protein V3O24_04430 [Methylobacter sp. Wu8]|uniref:hypothetical protein n=1 Tax=Methylobacter sp. Wu8 TaxID=3118457 RepID=UPI002F2E7193